MTIQSGQPSIIERSEVTGTEPASPIADAIDHTGLLEVLLTPDTQAPTELGDAFYLVHQLGVPEAYIAFVDTVIPPPAVGLRYGFKGAFTTDRPTVIWVFANWTTLEELRDVVRHEAAHLAFARTHTAEESAGHSGPSEDFARAFEEAAG